MKKSIIVAYLAAIHLLAILGIWHSGWVQAHIGTSSPHIAVMHQVHARMDGSVPAGASIFLGDSITEGLATAAVAPLAVNYGIGWQTSGDLLAWMPHYKSLSRAGTIYLMIGTNDFLQGKQAGLERRLVSIAEQLPPARIVWSGIPPIDSVPSLTPAIAHVDAAIRQICRGRPLCTYVDTTAALAPLGATAYIDGIHPTTAGYAAWIAALTSATHPPQTEHATPAPR